MSFFTKCCKYSLSNLISLHSTITIFVLVFVYVMSADYSVLECFFRAVLFKSFLNYYRPQQSCGKVIFSRQSFCSQWGVVSASVHAGIHSPGRYTPLAGTPLGRFTPWQVHPGQVQPPRQVHPPGRYTQPPKHVHPRGRSNPLGRYTHPPGRYTPWAGTPLGQVHPLSRYTPRAGTPSGQVSPGQVHPPGR